MIAIRVGGKTSVVQSFNKNEAISELYKLVVKLGVLPEGTELSLYYGATLLEPFDGKTIGDYGIDDAAVCKAIIGLKGGIDPRKQAKLVKQSLPSIQPLPGYITLTTEPCMIELEGDPDTYRARMPCGHAISSASMSQYCRSLLDEKQYSFRCPYVDQTTGAGCNYIWEFFMVRHVAALSGDELHEFETMITENYLNAANGVQECPGCGVYCRRMDERNSSVVCRLCTISKGKSYEFCWFCLQLWKNPQYTNNCGNPGCKNEDRRLAMLRESPKKLIAGVLCPSLRACPSCGMLITHADSCKHMTCSIKSCRHEFCFICLKPKNSRGAWPCGGYSQGCPPAPLQTQL